MLRAERGQASVELLAGLPALFLCALIGLQLLLAGYALSLADGAAEAGAAAEAAGLDGGAAGLGARAGQGQGPRRRGRGQAGAACAAGGDLGATLGLLLGVGAARLMAAGHIMVSAAPGAGASLPLAAAVAVEAALVCERAAVLVEAAAQPRRRPATVLAAPGARELEGYLREAGLAAIARGHLCHLAVGANEEGLAHLQAAAVLVEEAVLVVHVPQQLWEPALRRAEPRPRAAVLLAELPRDRSLAALACGELARERIRTRVFTRPLPPLAARRALAGIRPGGRAGRALARFAAGLARLGQSERGQSLPSMLAAGAVLIVCALLLAAIGGAVTGASRVQRTADLAALSAARSMRDDLPRLLAPALLPSGMPNPAHLSRGEYLSRARAAAVEAARKNELDPARLRISFPGAALFPPL